MFVPGTLAAPCLTCFGFQPGCTYETTGKCPLVEIPVANLAITAKAGVGGALVLQNAVSNKYNRVINREGLNSLQALMRRPFDGTPVTITKTTTMKTILGSGAKIGSNSADEEVSGQALVDPPRTCPCTSPYETSSGDEVVLSRKRRR